MKHGVEVAGPIVLGEPKSRHEKGPLSSRAGGPFCSPKKSGSNIDQDILAFNL